LDEPYFHLEEENAVVTDVFNEECSLCQENKIFDGFDSSWVSLYDTNTKLAYF